MVRPTYMKISVDSLNLFKYFRLHYLMIISYDLCFHSAATCCSFTEYFLGEAKRLTGTVFTGKEMFKDKISLVYTALVSIFLVEEEKSLFKKHPQKVLV